MLGTGLSAAVLCMAFETARFGGNWRLTPVGLSPLLDPVGLALVSMTGALAVMTP